MNDTEFRHLVEHVRQRTDLVALIGEHAQLRPCGSVLKGRSPRNRDADPSLVVWPHTQTWRDFSGGNPTGGDCFDWVTDREQCSFRQALESLAARAGVEIPGISDEEVAKELSQIVERRKLEYLHTAAAAYYHGVLPSKIRQTWYTERYGFTDETVDSLLLGWADGHLYEHVTGLLDYSAEEALATGLFVRLKDGRVEDFFKDRLVFPYWRHGRVAYFIARATEHTGDEPWEQAKYKKLPTHSDRHPYVSQLVANDVFYNEDGVRGAEQVLITEGVTDCISAIQCGVVCISPVTVRFRRKDHPRLLSLTASVRRVVICNDSEESGAGEAGAVETAQALYAAGRDVRIARIARPEGTDKIDLNEFVVSQGPDALRSLLGGACPFPEFLIEAIPADTPKAELAESLKPVLDVVRAAGPLEQEAYGDLVRKRFKLKAATVKALLRPVGGGGGEQRKNPKRGEEAPREARKGEVIEDVGQYYILGRDGSPVVISSFQIEPTQRIAVVDGEIIDANVTTDRGHVVQGVRFPREAWHSKRNFLRVLKSADLQFTGSDENVQGVLRLVASRSVPVRKGTMNLGYIETGDGPRWVTPEGVLGPPGIETSAEDIVYVPSGSSLPHRVQYRAPSSADVERAAAKVVLPNLLRLNTAEVILPVLGWFFAAPLRPRIMELLHHFPVLIVWGSAGSGKSTLIMEVFWPLLGVVSAAPYSATETEFALLKLLSATNSVPVFIDEYKPFDMPRQRRNALHRYMRRLYTGEVEERGRADQTVVTYHLGAPLCVAGETRPIEPALVERMVTSNPDRDQLSRDPQHAEAFTRMQTVNPGLLSAGIVRFLLGRNTEQDLTTARNITDRILTGREVPFRVRDNLTVMVLGLIHFEEYAQSMGVAIPELNLGAAFGAVLDDLLEGGGKTVKSGLDYFLEELSVMAISGEIQHGKHYVYEEGSLALHFPSCHSAFTEHCRRTGFEGEVPDRKAMRRQLVEAHRRGSYITELDSLVCFNGRDNRRRAILVDLEEAKQTLTVDDFPRSESSETTGWGGGWKDGS